MVLESKWADAPDVPKKKAPHQKKAPQKKANSTAKKVQEEKPRLTFSLKEKPTNNTDKKALLKKKIEEQRQIYEKNQHQKQQKELLESFLNDDGGFQWSDEDEEDKILEKLNKSLKL